MPSIRPPISDTEWTAVEEQAARSGYRSTDEYLQALLVEARERGAKAGPEASDGDEGPASWEEPAPEAVLRHLQGDALGPTERRQLVIEAEVLPFNAALRPQWNEVLRNFIEQNRDSQDPRDLVAVGSAIRKLVANLPPDELAMAATLLDAGHRAVPPPDVELEVAKAVLRRLASHPAQGARTPASLAEALLDLARTYLHDRLLVREKHGAVALNASLALLLMGGEYGREVIERLKGLRQTWFTELLARRAGRLKDEWSHRAEAESPALLDEALELFANAQWSQGPPHAGAAS